MGKQKFSFNKFHKFMNQNPFTMSNFQKGFSRPWCSTVENTISGDGG